ncbi:MAG TPA: hypothetical protein VHX61_10010 [Rhizomicrobium sp.]|nr:hypothetical protein [Rhizomicrobium sp.]
MSAYGNTIDVSLTGPTEASGYVLFDGAQFGNSVQEIDMLLNPTAG